MAAYSSAYSGLVTRLKEIESLLEMARITEKNPSRRNSLLLVGALCRSGVVLLCSHIEGYIENLGTLAIEQIERKNLPKDSMPDAFRFYLSRDLIDEVKQLGNAETSASKIIGLFSRDGHIWNSDPLFSAPLSASTFIGNFATPKHVTISSFFRRFGYEEFHGDLSKRLTTQAQACTNMVDQVVDQRNKIAHGDQVTTNTPLDLENMLKFVKLYCRTLDQIVGDWFRSVGCPIR